jgi:hypothetical protein
MRNDWHQTTTYLSYCFSASPSLAPSAGLPESEQVRAGRRAEFLGVAAVMVLLGFRFRPSGVDAGLFEPADRHVVVRQRVPLLVIRQE